MRRAGPGAAGGECWGDGEMPSGRIGGAGLGARGLVPLLGAEAFASPLAPPAALEGSELAAQRVRGAAPRCQPAPSLRAPVFPSDAPRIG